MIPNPISHATILYFRRLFMIKVSSNSTFIKEPIAFRRIHTLRCSLSNKSISELIVECQ